MANRHGDFIWYELLTTDTDAASRFYGAVLGWQARPMEGASHDYNNFAVNGVDVAGFMKLREGAEKSCMRPCWLGYVGVDDVDATVENIMKAGGAQYMPPTDIPSVGRMAMMADPQGVAFYVMRGESEETSPSFSQSKLGHCHWNELSAKEQTAALAFYSSLFGWTKGDAMPMGAMGDYQFIDHHGQTIGAMMNRTEDGPPPAWTFYFGVDDIDRAASAVSGNGGMIHYGPAEVPGGVYIIVASDPQGAMFGLVGPRKASRD
ncbi:VOC family protein [Microvirga sp. ACRRW]|uniref:VOC family protein n=1 Tax=Microvirga sp. ACRRW TaxID=2918205 RepID=UPI001EF59A87|nr:VOC family protein [Microvirga sp. ACRRW]MCG7392289.1 VOC family protein [Microvirga sp. ACRRW]